jgi:SUN domain-containing protein 1/2
MSKDNKAYKPSQESEDESEWSDDGKTRRRRRKFKKGPAGGPLSSLPVVTADKRRRKKSRGNLLDADEDDSGSDGNRQVDTVCPLFPLATFQLTRSVSPYTRLSHYKIRMRHLHDQLTTSHRTTLTTPCYQPNKASNQYQKWRKSFF